MLKFDIMLGHACNFRCVYCYERHSVRGYTSDEMSHDTIDKTLDFISRTCVNEQAMMCFFGGEPLLHMDKFEYILDKVRDNKQFLFNIITNGMLIDKYLSRISVMSERLPRRLAFAISYDYAMQDNRHEGTYEHVRKNIMRLRQLNIPVSTITVFRTEDLRRYDEVIKDCNDLRRHMGHLKAVFNIDRSTCDDVYKYEDEIKSSFSRAKSLGIPLIYINAACESGGNDPRCLFANVYAGIDCDGSIYPTQNAVFHTDKQRELMCYGNVHDSYEDIQKRRKYIFSQVDNDDPDECKACVHGCRRYKWRTIETSYDEYNRKHKDSICYTYDLISRCLNGE